MRSALLTMVAMAAAWTLGSAEPACAQGAQYELNIERQPLSRALQEFAKQSGIQIIFFSKLTDGYVAPALSGRFTAAAAVARLLDDTPLTFRELNSKTIEVQSAPAALDVGAAGASVARTRRAIRLAQADTTFDAEDRARSEAAGAASAFAPGDSAERSATRIAELEEVIVTGTHIADVAPAGAPVLILDAEAIRQSGYSSTEQVLQALPQNFRGGSAGASADGALGTGSLKRVNQTAGSGVNLRGLGSTATLVLINGRRMSASSGGTYTDISVIPIDAIERIEILTDGASAIYGADAVAGVVNVILKKDYSGAESRARYGMTTDSGREEYRLSQNFGAGWDSGGVMLSADYLHQSQLSTSERDFTANVLDPTSIFPANELASLILSGNQRLGERWSVQADMQYSQSERRLISASGSPAAPERTDNLIEPVRTNAGLGLEYRAFGDWKFSLDGSYSEEDAETRLRSVDQTSGAQTLAYIQTQTQDQWSAELRGDGTLFAIPAGAVKLAVGASYREEKYFRHIDLYGSKLKAGRDVRSVFVELHAPLVGDANAVAGIRSLELSIAGRYDEYSDFGGTSNPRIGVSWAPVDSFTVRSSYSTSFRAPSTGEELRYSDRGVLALEIDPFFAPDGNGFVPVVLLFGSEPLVPEESTNWTFGFDWQPHFLPDLQIGFTYYDISYTDRIIVPPLDFGALSNPELQAFIEYYDSPAEVAALVDRYVQQGAFFDDFTFGMFGPDPLSQVTATYNYLWTNADSVDVSGFDLTLGYPFRWGENELSLGLNTNYIDEMVNIPAPGATPYDLVDTFANPADLRMRGSLTWSRGGFSGALNVNYTGSYTDTAGLVDRPVESYTTIDATTRYTFARTASALLKGLSLSLILTNMLDEDPPYIEFGGEGANYDAANASPLGRMVAFGISKRW